MTQPVSYFAKLTLLATCSVLVACGSESGTLQVDSNLLGIYTIDSFVRDSLGCSEPTQLDPAPERVVLYTFVANEEPDEPLLGARRCGTVEQCRAAALAAEPPLIEGYAFIQGSDADGWLGWAIAEKPVNDQCGAEVDAHVLTGSGNTIEIETRTFDTVFPPTNPGESPAICSNRDALLSLDEDTPCVGIDIVDATFETGI